MKENLKGILVPFLRPVADFLHSHGWMRKEIIIKMDGGISSQIHFFLVGETMRRQGYEVRYDLDWYRDEGRDGTGRFPRNFDLLRLSPGLRFKIETNRWKKKLYRLLYTNLQDFNAPMESWTGLKPPAYFNGYYGVNAGFYSDIHRQVPITIREENPKIRELASEILNEPEAVGMHVRRGDLAQYVPTYGFPVEKTYFIDAVNELRSRHGDSLKFYIFSDEPEWVRSELLDYLPEGNYVVMDSFGSDKGYIDLWLLSLCRHFIASKGSFGKFAPLFSKRRGDVILPDDHETRIWQSHLPGATAL